MVLRSSAWSLPWDKGILMMLLTPFGVDLWNTLLYHLEALQLSFSPFFLCSFPTLSEGYNTGIRYAQSFLRVAGAHHSCHSLLSTWHKPLQVASTYPIWHQSQLGPVRTSHPHRLVVWLDLSLRRVACTAQSHSRYECAGEPGCTGCL